MDDMQNITETFQTILKDHARKAWKPLTEDGDGGQLASKFSGTPWLAQTETWPTCEGCGGDLSFFLQLRTDSLPDEAKASYGDGLLQMFYCTSCDDWEPFSESHLVRLEKVEGAGKALGTLPADSLPAKAITGWEAFEDYPGFEDLEDTGVALPWPKDYGEMEEVEERLIEQDTIVRAGDKLAGWPYWVQSPEYPSCPKCGAQMRLVFQLDSNVNLDYMFGDAGAGHITQCAEHKEVLAFGWACH